MSSPRPVAIGQQPVAMSGGGTFFGGKLSATITISRGIGARHRAAPRAGRGGGGGTHAEYADISGMDNRGRPWPT